MHENPLTELAGMIFVQRRLIPFRKHLVFDSTQAAVVHRVIHFHYRLGSLVEVHETLYRTDAGRFFLVTDNNTARRLRSWQARRWLYRNTPPKQVLHDLGLLGRYILEA
jgi:hypothetical protein